MEPEREGESSGWMGSQSQLPVRISNTMVLMPNLFLKGKKCSSRHNKNLKSLLQESTTSLFFQCADVKGFVCTSTQLRAVEVIPASVSFALQWQSTWEYTLKQERFILVYGSRVSRSWSADSTTFRLVEKKQYGRGHDIKRENTCLAAARKQGEREAEKGARARYSLPVFTPVTY